MKKGVDYPGISIVFLCHDGEGNYLLNKRSLQCRDEHGRWDCGGGGLDLGEKVEDVLKKEIQEEYTTDILEYEFLGFRDVHRKNDEGVSHWITLDFKVLVDRKKVKNGEPHKFDEIQWFSLNALPEPLHSQLPAALQKYKSLL
jgi:8-oxo-dGTP diphosphatase